MAAQTLREAANLVLGALIVGQFLGGGPSSPWLLVVGGVMWLVFAPQRLSARRKMTMANALIVASTAAVLGMILAIVINVVGNRQDRQAKQR